MSRDTYSLPKEHNIGFYQPITALAPRYPGIDDSFLDLFVIVRAFAVNALLCGKTPMSFNDLLLWDPRPPLKRINVLGEACVEKIMRMQHFDERVSNGWPIATRVKLFCERIDLATQGNFKRMHELQKCDNLHGIGFLRKKSIWNTASGYGKLSRARLA